MDKCKCPEMYSGEIGKAKDEAFQLFCSFFSFGFFFFKNWPEKKAVQFGSYQWRNPKKLAWGNGSYDGEAEEESLDERKCI